MADDGAAHEPASGPIGRVRIEDPPAVIPQEAGSAAEPEESGWSVAGVGLALLLAIVMIGALIIILWATFQARV